MDCSEGLLAVRSGVVRRTRTMDKLGERTVVACSEKLFFYHRASRIILIFSLKGNYPQFFRFFFEFNNIGRVLRLLHTEVQCSLTRRSPVICLIQVKLGTPCPSFAYSRSHLNGLPCLPHTNNNGLHLILCYFLFFQVIISIIITVAEAVHLLD